MRRFYLTLMLWAILNRTGIWDVAAKFEVPRGFVQNLFSSAASFGSSVQRFCEVSEISLARLGGQGV